MITPASAGEVSGHITSSDDPPQLSCPQGHALQRRTSRPSYYRGGWICDGCDTLLPQMLEPSDGGVLHCHACAYDLCKACADLDLAVGASAARSIVCPSGHPLQLTRIIPSRYRGHWVCDGCDQILPPKLTAATCDTRYARHCDACSYDLCERCCCRGPSAKNLDPVVESNSPAASVDASLAAPATNLRAPQVVTSPTALSERSSPPSVCTSLTSHGVVVNIVPIDPVADRASLVALHDVCFPSYFGPDFFDRMQTDPRTVGFVALSQSSRSGADDPDEVVVAACAIGFEVRCPPECGCGSTDGRAGYLASFAVGPSFRRLGIGRLLLDRFCQHFFNAGYVTSGQFVDRSLYGGRGERDDRQTIPPCRQNGSPPITQVLLHCVACDHSLFQFYSRCGFRLVGILDDYYVFHEPQWTIDGEVLASDVPWNAAVMSRTV